MQPVTQRPARRQNSRAGSAPLDATAALQRLTERRQSATADAEAEEARLTKVSDALTVQQTRCRAGNSERTIFASAFRPHKHRSPKSRPERLATLQDLGNLQGATRPGARAAYGDKGGSGPARDPAGTDRSGDPAAYCASAAADDAACGHPEPTGPEGGADKGARGCRCATRRDQHPDRGAPPAQRRPGPACAARSRA